MHLASKCFDLAIILCGHQEQCSRNTDSTEFSHETLTKTDPLSSRGDIPVNRNDTLFLSHELSSLFNRRGNLSNERGVFYVNQADLLAKSEGLNFKGQIPEAIVKILNVSMEYLMIGLNDFKVSKSYCMCFQPTEQKNLFCYVATNGSFLTWFQLSQALNDIPNQALILSNSGRHCRLNAYCFSLVETEEDAKEEIEFFLKECQKYEQAIGFYEEALKLLMSPQANYVGGGGKGRRNQYSKIYESVSWDLQTTCFIFGSRVRS